MTTSHILLTGATGFVGKVVLEQLMRRRHELGVASVSLIIRTPKDAPDKAVAAAKRFQETIASSKLFAELPADWTNAVHPLAGDLEQARCGLEAADYEAVIGRVTHVIHCAASVEFDLPIAEAASANVKTALEVLELARACANLVGMVDVSTAYVNAWMPGPIEERLASLPRPAAEFYADISEGRRTEADLLGETGHPNTYTFTKCLAEHLICQRRGEVPVTIVRPSIISATWREPNAGWVDSAAALAGCVLFSGIGVVRAWRADPSKRLDVVPVDLVAQDIVEAAFAPMAGPNEAVEIRHAAVGVRNAIRLDVVVKSTVAYFANRSGNIRKPDMFMGRTDQGFGLADLWRRALPNQLGRTAFTLLGKTRELKRLNKADERVQYLNDAFEYFTHHTFDFRRKRPFALEGFHPNAYMGVVLQGIERHLLKRDPSQESFAGKAHDDARSDVAWLREFGQGSLTMQTLGLALRKAMQKAAGNITFDRTSFERAIASAPADALFVLAPSHRSYLDFLLSSYLMFVHPELGVEVPHIAAAQEFGKIPLVGRILRDSRAFYIKRGVGREAPELSQELKRLSAKGASLMFFVEGQRSRSRMFLAPKRGMLRGLQNTGRTFAVLPIAISYDRLPEEAALERELLGAGKAKMGIAPLLKWLGELAQGKVQLGRMHIACGELQVLDGGADVARLAKNIVAEQQKHTTVSAFHLRTFLAEAGLEPSLGIDEAWLTEAITARGGKVIASDLPAAVAPSPTLAQSLRNQWMHWFYGDALTRYPDNMAIRDHVARNAWMPVPAAPSATPATAIGHTASRSTRAARGTINLSDDARINAVVDALMLPVVQAYQTATALIGSPSQPMVYPSPLDLIRDFPTVHLPLVEDAYAALAEHKVVSSDAGGRGYTWGDRTHVLDEIRSHFAPKFERFS